MSQAKKRVILLIDSASEFDRKLLRGIVEYSNDNGPWQFYRMPPWTIWDPEGEKRILERARNWKADAIIGLWNPTKEPQLSSLGIPVVLQNYHSRSSAYSVITGDYIGTGSMAASFFIGRGAKNFAYFGLSGVVWSEERRQGFEKAVSQAGYSTHVLETESLDNTSMIASWLVGLPKPVALFACDDAHALAVSEICKVEGIRIPEDLQLLGVDNDDLLCEISDPPISSIALDVEKGGRMICRLLDTQSKGNWKPFTVTIRPICVVERSSTKRHLIADPIIEKVVNFLDDNFTRDLTMAEILEPYPLSRRSIETRFRKAMGTSIWQYLQNLRVEKFTRMLVSIDLPLKEIALECGFRDTDNIARTFRKYHGISPQEYRKH